MSILDRIKDALRDRDHWRRVALRKEASADELADAIGDLDRDLDRKLKRIKVLRRQERRPEKREELADEIDELRGEKGRLLERLDHAKNKGKRARTRMAKETKEIQRLRRKRERIQKDRAGRLTKDFHVAEFDCNDGTPVPNGIIPHLKALCENHLQPLRNTGGPIHINSGYRHAAYNASIGGASQSYHIYDLRMKAPAADHIQSGRSATAVQSWYDSHTNPDGMGYYGGFTHIDDRGYRSRWWGAA